MPGPEDLLAFARSGNMPLEDLPFFPVTDIGIINGNFNDIGNLPYVVVLDDQMVIRLRGANPGMGNVVTLMEDLLLED